MLKDNRVRLNRTLSSTVMNRSIKKNLRSILAKASILAIFVATQIFSTPTFAAADPGSPGPLPVLAKDYGSYTPISGLLPTAGTAKVEFLGRVWYPATMTGSYPLIIMLHGQHGTCYGTSVAPQMFPCVAPYANNVPNYAGYDYLAKQLASYGYIVASISANGVNALPPTIQTLQNNVGQLRAELIQKHLDLWRLYNNGQDPWGGVFRGHVDLTRVSTLGHSRGGEGVVRHYIYNKSLGSPYGIKAVLPLAPTNFGRHAINGVPMAVLLPYCDGDVSDLQGARYFDDNRYNVAGDNEG